MRRRPPPEVDPDRLRSLLASARPKPEPPAPTGWVPEEEPPPPEPGWLDERPWPDGEDPVATWPATGGSTSDAGLSDPSTRALGLSESEVDPSGRGRHRRPPRVLTVPVALRGARIAVSVRAVVAFVVVLVVAVVFFAVRVARAQEAATPQPVPAGDGVVGRSSVPSAFAATLSGPGPAASAGGPDAAGSPTTGATARGSPRTLVVDVVGEVARPGVVTVPDGSRVVDVLAAAGGPLSGADVQRLNLARIVADGEQVFVPRPGETPPVPVGVLAGSPAGSGAGGGMASGPGGVASPGVPVDLNTASLAALDTLPGVGPVLAQRILDWRAQHGRFATVDELGEVSGIGDKLLDQIRPKVRV
jgi:competence protein ComEA